MEKPFRRGAQPQVLWTYLPWLLTTYVRHVMILQVRTHQKPQRLIPSAFGKDVRDWLSWTRHNHWRLVELTWTPKKTSDHCWCFRHPAPVWCGKKSFYQSQNFSHQEYLFDFSWNFTLTNRSPQQKIHSTGSILRKFPVFHLWDMGSLNFQNLWGLSFTYFMKKPFLEGAGGEEKFTPFGWVEIWKY